MKRTGLGVLIFTLLLTNIYAQSSTDTNLWKLRRSQVRQDLLDVAYGKGVFVAVGESATILSSPNGRQWTVQAFQTNSANRYNAVAFGNGMFVAVGDGAQKIRTSEDGLVWGPSQRGAHALYDVVFGEGRFVAVGDAILTSINGRDWTRVRRIPTAISIAYGNSRFVALGNDQVWVSRNGTRWTNSAVDVPGNFSSIVFNGQVFIASAEDFETSTASVWTSEDGLTWSLGAQPAFPITAMAQSPDNNIAAIGELPDEMPGRIQVSPDGLGWPGEATETSRIPYGVTFGRGTVVVVGERGLVLQARVDELGLTPE